jgi:hypothetical protein
MVRKRELKEVMELKELHERIGEFLQIPQFPDFL